MGNPMRRFDFVFRSVVLAGLAAGWYLGGPEMFFDMAALLGAMAWLDPPKWG
jgi:hypothetical protein